MDHLARLRAVAITSRVHPAHRAGLAPVLAPALRAAYRVRQVRQVAEAAQAPAGHLVQVRPAVVVALRGLAALRHRAGLRVAVPVPVLRAAVRRAHLHVLRAQEVHHRLPAVALALLKNKPASAW